MNSVSGCRSFWLLFGVIIFFSFPCYYSEEAPNYSFLKQGTSAPLLTSYDYIIIGGGTAGCALAATLSERSDVLVLERGGSPFGKKNIEDIRFFASNLVDLSPSSPAQRFISEDGVFNHRARVLGGGSAINAGFYTRASPSYAAEAGWDGALVNRSYEWVEKKVAFEPPMLQFQSAVRDGLLEAGVLPYNGFTYDHVYGTKVGGTIFDENGKRHTAADLLEYADPRRTAVYLHATVHKVLFSAIKNETGSQRPRAIGVIFMDTNGVMHRAYLRPGASNEVILSAGAIGSTQLLMLSGIGPAEELKSLGIDVILDQPMVGQRMADNPMNAIFIPSPRNVEFSLAQVVGITEFDSYIEAGSSSDFARAFFPNLPEDTRVYPSQQKNQSLRVDDDKTVADIAKAYDFMYSLINGTLRVGVIAEKTIGPRSIGYLRLKNRDPNDNPSVAFNYFQEQEDLERCVKGLEIIVKVIESNSFSGFRFPLDIQSLFNTMAILPLNLRPRHLDTAFNLEQFCKDTVMTIWHYHGGCQVGKVVDKDYKVMGVDALRVIDVSTLHDSPGTNPQATLMMLGRYMGLRILGERGAI